MMIRKMMTSGMTPTMKKKRKLIRMRMINKRLRLMIAGTLKSQSRKEKPKLKAMILMTFKRLPTKQVELKLKIMK
jgi:hypothetical protein